MSYLVLKKSYKCHFQCTKESAVAHIVSCRLWSATVSRIKCQKDIGLDIILYRQFNTENGHGQWKQQYQRVSIKEPECVSKTRLGEWLHRSEAQSLFRADPLPSFFPHLPLSGQPCKSLFHRGLQRWDITNQWADEAELLMLTKWNNEGVPR